MPPSDLSVLKMNLFPRLLILHLTSRARIDGSGTVGSRLAEREGIVSSLGPYKHSFTGQIRRKMWHVPFPDLGGSEFLKCRKDDF